MTPPKGAQRRPEAPKNSAMSDGRVFVAAAVIVFLVLLAIVVFVLVLFLIVVFIPARMPVSPLPPSPSSPPPTRCLRRGRRCRRRRCHRCRRRRRRLYIAAVPVSTVVAESIQWLWNSSKCYPSNRVPVFSKKTPTDFFVHTCHRPRSPRVNVDTVAVSGVEISLK